MPRPGTIARALVTLTLAAAAPLCASDITTENVVRLMNQYRVLHGVAPLVEEPRLDRAAEARMDDMEEQGYWAHVAPDGTSPFVMFRRCGYDFRAAGENLAKGFETAEVLVAAWMDSPGHRANILGAQYRNVGVAIIDGETTKRANGHSVVVEFGAERQVETYRSSRGD